MTYRTPILVGDRVALAPHLDLWMAGRRFGDVLAVAIDNIGRRYFVEFDGGPLRTWLRGEDLLGAVNPVPGQSGASPSTDPYETVVRSREPR